jgi:hypothetical protein
MDGWMDGWSRCIDSKYAAVHIQYKNGMNALHSSHVIRLAN